MASKTFYHLREDRQKEIYEIAMEAFVSHSYEDASLNRIIDACGVAKGSFYRYFQNKRELFHDLIQYTRAVNIDNFEKAFAPPVDDIFAAWKAFYLSTYEYDQNMPLYTGFLFLSSYSLDKKETYILRQKNIAVQAERIKAILIRYRERDQMDTQIDPAFLAYTLLDIHDGVFDYLNYRYQIDFHERATKRLPLFAISRQELESVLDSYIYFLKKGAGIK